MAPNALSESFEQSAIIVSHGQPSDPDPAEDVLAEFTSQIARLLKGWNVQSATLAKEGALEDAMQRAGAQPLIYPLFMTDGWFVRSALPARLGPQNCAILPPLGVDPSLPKLAASALVDTLDRQNWDAAETALLIASHGSGRSPNSARDTEVFAKALSLEISMKKITTGYVEQAPFFPDVAKEVPEQSICLPFFAAYGGHVREDIADGLSQARFKGPCLDPLGTLPGIHELIAASLHSASVNETAA